MNDTIQPDGRYMSPAERAARTMARLGMGYDVDGPARDGMLSAADQILRSSGVLAYDPVTKVILDNCARAYFEWAVTPRWQFRQRRRKQGHYVGTVDRMLEHVRGKVLLQEVYGSSIHEPGPMPYDQAREAWGEDPALWPSWFCKCGQRNTGWSMECGRCEKPRRVQCLSTHGGSGHSPGTYSINNEREVVCGTCGAITPNPGWLPDWVTPR